MSKSTAVIERPETLPSALPSGYGQVDAVLPEQSRTPYVGFIYEMTQGYSTFLSHIKDLRVGEPVLVCPAPSLPVALRPFRFFLLSASQFWAEYAADKSGKMLRSSAVKVEGWKETVEALVLVFTKEGGLVPAQVRFKSTTCPAFYAAKRALDECVTPAWAKKGPDYALSAQIAQPWARFVVTANRTEATNRTTGTRYPTMEAVANPTSGAEGVALAKFFQSQENRELLDAVKAVYIKRLEDAKKKEVKG